MYPTDLQAHAPPSKLWLCSRRVFTTLPWYFIYDESEEKREGTKVHNEASYVLSI